MASPSSLIKKLPCNVTPPPPTEINSKMDSHVADSSLREQTIKSDLIEFELIHHKLLYYFPLYLFLFKFDKKFVEVNKIDSG